MNIKTRFLLLIALLACIVPARAMTNAFTYQGRLSDANGPASDVFSMIFVLHDHPTDGDGIGVTVLPEVPVSNGLFTAQLAFPPQQLNGADRWLAVNVRRAANTNSPLTELMPRQLLTPAPYALMARSVPDGAISAQHIAPGAVGGTQLASNAVAGAITPGSITAAMLAPGAASANLAVQNQSAVGSGGVILSENANNTNLLTAGYVKIGKVELVPEKLEELAAPPIYAGSLLRAGHSTVWTGTEYIIWGGYSPHNFNVRYNDGARYNPTTDTWTYIGASNAPSARYDHQAVWTGTEMIIWGGTGGWPDRGARYNPATGEWTLITTNGAPVFRRDATVAWAGTHLVVWGGFTVVEDQNDDEIHIFSNAGARYNPVTDTWTSMAFVGAPSPRANASAVWTGSELLIWGGRDQNNVSPDGDIGTGALQTGSRYNPGNNSWTPMTTNNAPEGREDHSVIWTGSEMIVWGGRRYEWESECPGWPVNCYYRTYTQLLNTGARYNPANNTWTTISTANAPWRRRTHSAVWTGSRMVVWGGLVYGQYYPDNPYDFDAVSTGGIYNPVTDSWTATATLNAPEPRSDHASVWTGSRMLIWGATSINGNWAESSGRFDPVANSWSEMAISGDVVKRTGHTTVWTGSELLVWGGQDAAGNTMRSGLRFDPVRNQWSFMTLAGSPDPRKHALSAWTGTEMIVWGGEDATGTKLRSGARYNPTTDSWIALPTENSPAQRTEGTATWAGGHFVVWGGRIGSIYTATGGRFNPATGQWQPTALPPAGFSARRHHTAVSIGDSVIYWGGANVTNLFNDGATYHPAADTWTLLPQAGAPTARTNHTAVWSGTEMIVFGGADATASLRTGGRFNPATGVWTPTTAEAATQFGRSGHRAVWAYDRMITVRSKPLIHMPATDTWTEGTISTDPESTHAHWTGAEVLWWTGDGGCQSYSPARTTFLYTRP